MVIKEEGARLAGWVSDGPNVERLKAKAAEWQAKADEFKAEILERGVRDGIFRQHYDTDALDASLLLIPLFRFLPPDDPRVRDTVNAIAEPLAGGTLIDPLDGLGDLQAGRPRMGGPLGILEAEVDFALEASVIVARGIDGSMALYPPVENRHRHHILDETIAPADWASLLEVVSFTDWLTSPPEDSCVPAYPVTLSPFEA